MGTQKLLSIKKKLPFSSSKTKGKTTDVIENSPSPNQYSPRISRLTEDI